MSTRPDTEEYARAERKAHRTWIGGMFGLLAVVVVVNFGVAYVASQHKPGLVVEDYYEEGLAYDQVMQAEARAHQLQLQLRQTGRSLQLLQDGVPVAWRQGQLKLQRPDQPSLDTVLQVAAGGTLDLQQLKQGRWQLAYQFRCDEQDCLIRGQLFLDAP